MLTLLVICLGIAALFGFGLSMYFFVFRVKGNIALRLIAGTICGLVTGTVMAMASYVLLWPPVSFLLIAVGLGFVAYLASVVLRNTPSAGDLSGSAGVLCEQEDGDLIDADVYNLVLGLDRSPRS